MHSFTKWTKSDEKSSAWLSKLSSEVENWTANALLNFVTIQHVYSEQSIFFEILSPSCLSPSLTLSHSLTLTHSIFGPFSERMVQKSKLELKISKKFDFSLKPCWIVRKFNNAFAVQFSTSELNLLIQALDLSSDLVHFVKECAGVCDAKQNIVMKQSL